MFNIVDSTIVRFGDIISGTSVITNEEQDSVVIFSGSDTADYDVNELERMMVVLDNIPEDIREFKFKTCSIKMEGPHAIQLLKEIFQSSMDTVKDIINTKYNFHINSNRIHRFQ